MSARFLVASPFPDASELTLSVEYFFNLFPCYLFIVTGICRYISLYRAQSPSEDSNTEDDESDSVHSNEPAPALIIKVKLSYFMAFLYFLEIPLTFLLPEPFLFSAGTAINSLWYLVGFFSWILSAKLIEIEFDKEYAQELYTHQIFCPATMIVSLLNILLKENLLVDLVLHIIKMITSLWLSLYVCARPNDRIDPLSSEPMTNENMTSAELKEEKQNCIQSFLLKFESLKCVQKIFRYDLNKLPESIPLLEIKPKNNPRISRTNSSNPHSNSISQTNICIPNMIPENRQIIVEPVGNEGDSALEALNPSYIITTKLNDKLFISKHKTDEILEFYNFISTIYNAKDFPDFSDQFPEFRTTNNNSKDIEDFLNGLLAEPAFIHPRFLDFLKITTFLDRKPFTEYFNSIVPKRSVKLTNSRRLDSITAMSPSLRRNSENNAEYRELDDSLMPISLLNINIHKMVNFEVSCSGWEKAKDQNHYLFIFHLKCLSNQVVWTIKKSCSDVKEFDKVLMESIKRNTSMFKTYVPKKTEIFRDMNNVFLEERRKGLERYMKEILNDKSCYDEYLFNFIEFDIERRMPYDAKENDLNYSFTEDEINAENLIEACSPVEFHSLKDNNVIVVDEKQGKWGIIKQNECWSPSFKTKRKVVSDINFNNVRIIFVGVKSVVLQNTISRTQPSKRSITVNGKVERNYFLNLEEVESISPRINNIRTVIKLSKNYRELEEFDKIIRQNFENDFLPSLPDDDDGNDSKKRNMWDEYFLYLINIRMIEENQTFKDFFHLDRARNKYMYDSEKKETFKLDLTNY